MYHKKRSIMAFAKTSGSLRKDITGYTLAFEYGANLGISFIDHRNHRMKSFQLTEDEMIDLISFLKKYSIHPTKRSQMIFNRQFRLIFPVLWRYTKYVLHCFETPKIGQNVINKQIELYISCISLFIILGILFSFFLHQL